ncbi:MAG: Mfa1 fimbrilin C-terminal domain-containing protein [Parabacteroides sp.]|nr:Mfa1 fimbrilin C-terminal domain-containing protein [Parabacteroides sp.]
MKLKHYSLWALALAFAAVSCSDDLENSGKNGTDDGNGKKAYMTINISTVSDGVTTKADTNPSNPNDQNNAGWGEDGNGWLGELDKMNEGKVHNINVFLIKSDVNTLNSTNHLDLLNTEDNDKLTAKFAGFAYKELDPVLDASTNQPDGEANHGSRTVTVTMTQNLGTTSNPYQVFTIVNAGDLTNKITTLQELQDYVHYQVITDNEGDVKKADKFVMSTHKMYGTKGGQSIVNLSVQNTADNPASTSVYLERLAARIDLMYPTDGVLPLKNENSPVNEMGSFSLTGYMVVNQWKGGTKILKKVSPMVDSPTKDIASTASYNDSDRPYLGDEIWNDNNNGKYNFVLSEFFYDKIRNKIKNGRWEAEDKSTTAPAYYDNHFFGTTLNEEEIKDLPNTNDNLSYTDNTRTYFPIAYVRENTMNATEQLNGYSTGVIFRTKFSPDLTEFKMMKYDNDHINEVTLTDNTNFYFFTAEHFNASTGKVQKLVYADVKSVAARAFNIPNEGGKPNLLKGFMEGWDGTTITLDEAKTAVNGMSQRNLLSEKFKKYLSTQLESVNDGTQQVANWDNKAALTYDAFVDVQEDTYKKLLNKTDLSKYDATDIANLAEIYGIYFFSNGESYHKFWIRHDDNNDNYKMGVMEFAIVRNNVYQLNVTGVRGLGDPLPYTPGKDKPDTPDESNEVTIDVTIYVKDWVKRRNDNIVL